MRPDQNTTARDWRTGVAAALAVLVGGAGATTFALWSDALRQDATVASGKVGVGLGRVGGGTATATGPADVLALKLTESDAAAMVAAGHEFAVPFAVRLRADGHASLRYSLSLPTFAANSYFDRSDVRVFRLPASTDQEAQASCVAAAAPAEQPGLVDLDGVDAGTGPLSSTHYWCLTLTYSGSGGTYTNHATAEVAGLSDTDSWTAHVVDPGQLTATHEVSVP